ncbi:MAG: hypothetical protein C5B59_16370 [Bacteroidetes bacterium]|nr:MAG: hypothetical protein C5B59_16370 [Bacteroidota bacterium]
MPIKLKLLLLAVLFAGLQGIAQDKLNIKFGKVSPEDFDLSKHSFDTGASAVIIADIGNTAFEGNNKGSLSLLFKRFERIKILTKDAFEAANQSIIVYNDGYSEEKLLDLKASTYNLENGKVVETKLDDKSIFTDKITKYESRKKFTLPGVKAGSIIEISYSVRSDFYRHLRAWNFQGEYPCFWSEYEVTIPPFYHYVALNQGDQNFSISTSKQVGANYTLREPGGTGRDDIVNFNGTATASRWVMKDVPALKQEPYTTTLRNHISRIEFQLHYFQFDETSERHDYMGNWFIASEKLLDNENFGKALDEDNHWMSEDLRSITSGCKSSLEKMKKIYAYVRDNFTCTDHDALYTDNSLKTAFKKKNGNVAEINLLLTAMLRHEKIEADPIVLSTRDNGYASETYPLMERFNYVICAAKDSDRTYYLDASEPLLGFDHLPVDCYNGMARMINKEKPYVKYFDSDSLKEQKMTQVLIINDEKGHSVGSFQSLLGYDESYDLRERIRKKSTGAIFSDIQTNFGSDVKIENTAIDSLNKLEEPIKISYDFTLKNEGDEMIYFNPMMSEGYKDNPFKSAVRKYPVEMPYCMDELYTFSMEIPNGYTVEEVPKSARVALNENQGMFEYLVQKSDDKVMMRSRIRLNKAYFPPEEYNSLRDFFGYIVKKQSEQVVLKKKK